MPKELLKTHFAFEFLEDSNIDTNKKDLEDLEEKESQEVINKAKTEQSDLRDDMDEAAPAGIHETLDAEADVRARVARRFNKYMERSDRKRAKQANREDRKLDIVKNTKQLDELEQDKMDIVRDKIVSLTKKELKQSNKSKQERKELYTVLAKEFIEFWDEDSKGYVATKIIPNQIIIGNHIQGISPIVFNYADHRKMFDKLKAKDDKMDEYLKEANKQMNAYEALNKDGDVDKSELKSDAAFSNKEARRIARLDRKQDRQAPKAQKNAEKANKQYEKYADAVGNVKEVTTSIDTYTNKGKHLEQYDVETREAEGFDRLAVLICDYNMDSDVTPKPLKEWFQKKRGLAFLYKQDNKTKTKVDRYGRKSKGETPLSISASQLRECMRLARAEVKEEVLVKNLVTLINTNLYNDSEHPDAEVKKLPETLTTSDALFEAMSSDYHYVYALREGLANYANNVTDMLTLGGLTVDKENQYIEETQELIAFDALKQEYIARDLAQLQLSDVKDVREDMEADPSLSASEKEALKEFHKQVTEKADVQRGMALKRLQEIKATNPPADPDELKILDAQIAELTNSSISIPNFTLQGIAAFMTFNYQGLDTRTRISTDINGNRTAVVEQGANLTDLDPFNDVVYTKTTTGQDGKVTREGAYTLKDKLKRTTLNAFGIGTGGSLVNFKKRGARYADNISWGLNLNSAMGFNNRQFEKDNAEVEHFQKVIDNKIETLDQNAPDYQQKLDALNAQKVALADKYIGKEYQQRGYGLGVNVGYNGSLGLGKKIGDTQYYPANLYFGAGPSAGFNTIQGRTLGAYAYAGPGRMWNDGKLQHTLDAKSSKESGIIGSVGFGVRDGSLKFAGADAQFNIIKKEYIKGYEIVADAIRTTGAEVLTQIIKNLQGLADKDGKIKKITPESLKNLVRNALTYDSRFDRTKNKGTAIDHMAMRLFRMMKTMYPGIDTEQGAVALGDLNNPEIVQGVANNLAFQMSLNWLNENYDKLKGLKRTGLSINASTLLMILGGAVILPGPVALVGASAAFAFANLDRMKKSSIQEEDLTSKRTAQMMKEYNIGAREMKIGAREMKGEFLSTQIEHINGKINILCNTKGVDYLEVNRDGTVTIKSEITRYSSTVPVYVNPVYSKFYKTMQIPAGETVDKFHGGLVVPGHIASGIMTSVGKTKDGAIYVGYEAKDRNIFQDEVKDGEPRKQAAVLWIGQKFDGNPQSFNTENGYSADELKTLWVDDADKKFEIPKIKYALIIEQPHTLLLQDRETRKTIETIDMTKKSLVFNSVEKPDGSFDVTHSIVDGEDGKFMIKHIQKLKDGPASEGVSKPISFEYNEKNFDKAFKDMLQNIDANRPAAQGPNRSGLKAMTVAGKKPYNELSHIIDNYMNIDRNAAANYANQIIQYGKLGSYRFDATKKEEITRFMQELIGSKYCSVSNSRVQVGKGSGFGAMMASRTAGFEQRRQKDKDTSKVALNEMQVVRNSSLQGMFTESKLGLNLNNYRNQKESISFNEEGTSLLGVIYGYNGEDRTHDEKLVINPNMVSGSETPIITPAFRAYTVNQVKARYDKVFMGGLLGVIEKQTGLTGLKESDLAAIMNGSTDTISIGGGVLTISTHFFFYPECFNEGVGLKISYKAPGAPTPGETKELSGTLNMHEASGATGMFVNNITIGMGTEKRSIKGAAGVGLQVLPTSSTRIETVEKPSSSTRIETGILNNDPGANIPDRTYTVTTADGKIIRIGLLNGNDALGGFEYEDPNTGLPATISNMQQFLDQFGNLLDPSEITGLQNYNTAFTPVPDGTVTTTTVTPPPAIPAVRTVGYVDATQSQAIANATGDLQNPDKTSRNPRQQQYRLRRARPQ